jgi:hypothetical protein
LEAEVAVTLMAAAPSLRCAECDGLKSGLLTVKFCYASLFQVLLFAIQSSFRR